MYVTPLITQVRYCTHAICKSMQRAFRAETKFHRDSNHLLEFQRTGLPDGDGRAAGADIGLELR